MRLVPQRLSTKVHRRVARVIIGRLTFLITAPEALDARRSLHQRPVHTEVLGCVVKAPSTLGTFLRSFRWGHVRQLDRVSRELLARAWAAGAGPGDAPLTIDLDSTICETYGLGKEGARRHGYTGQRGYHPLLAVAAGTGEVLMSRLREGRANPARGARPLPAGDAGPGPPPRAVNFPLVGFQSPHPLKSKGVKAAPSVHLALIP